MPLPKEKRYTYADLLSWDGQERYELIDGMPYLMSSPSLPHQLAIGSIYRQISAYLDGKNCLPILSPFDVRLFEEQDDAPYDVDTVLVPDMIIVCDRSKLDERGCKGAPDMVVEVLSPSTQRHDRLVKMNLYQKAGVREYWLVDPMYQTVQVYLLENGQYRNAELYSAKDQAKVSILDACTVDLAKVFPSEE